MKRLYWRPQKVSRTAFALVAVLSILGMVAVEGLPVERQSPLYEEKVRAARLAATAMETIREERIRRGYPIELESDPGETGLIGVLSSPVTSTSGNLYSKQLATDPNFAAVIVALLDQAGVERGDTVAVGTSGSFPGLNVSTYAALATLDAQPVIITSAAASEWGANIIGFGWPDMEAALIEHDIWPYQAVAGSRGGLEDRGLGMSRVGLSMLRGMLDRHEIPVIEHEDVATSVEQRMRLFETHAGGDRIRAYVNVGGGHASMGGAEGRPFFRPGVNQPSAYGSAPVDSVMGRFIERGVPVIHLGTVHSLAQTWGIEPAAPGEGPTIGEGRIFVSVRYNAWLALGVLLLIVLALYAVTRSDVGSRLLASGDGSKKGSRPQPMA